MNAKLLFTFADTSDLEVGNDKIVQNGITFSRSSSSPGVFEIGGAKADEVEVVLNNIDHSLDNYVFETSEFQLYFYDNDWISHGYFKVDKVTYSGSMVTMNAYNRMVAFDTPLEDSGITAPITAGDLLSQICLYCGVPLVTTVFTNSTMLIPRLPESISCRALVGYIAQLSGNYAYINSLGQLALGWYSNFDILDGNGMTDIVDGNGMIEIVDGNPDYEYSTVYDLKSADIELFDITITGIEVKAQGIETDYGESYTYGDEGYVLSITNPLITEGTAQDVCEAIASKIVGLKFRPMSINSATNKIPTLGMGAFVSFRGNEYQTYINDFTYTLNVGSDISCFAETPLARLTNKGDSATTTLKKAQEETKASLSRYNQQIALLTNLMTYAFGTYKTEETQLDGSIIYYLHDQPLLENSTNIWKMTALAFAVSSDGGTTWNAGLDSNGNFTAHAIATGLLSAELIKAGSVITNEFEAKNFTISGGSINIDTGLSEVSKIIITGTYSAAEMARIGLKVYGLLITASCDVGMLGVVTRDGAGAYESRLRSESLIFYQGYYGSGTEVEKIKLNGTNGAITCVSLTQTSLEEVKKEIKKCPDMIDVVSDSEIYCYKMKDDKEEEINYRYGFIIGKNRNTPVEVLGQDAKGIDIYSMASINWKATQELIEENNQLKSKLSDLEERIIKLEEVLNGNRL